MQERHLYEYAVIRFVPKVEREEFINMGIVLFSKQAKYLKSLYTIDENELRDRLLPFPEMMPRFRIVSDIGNV